MYHVKPLHHGHNFAGAFVLLGFYTAQEPQMLLVKQPLIQHAKIHKKLNCLGRMNQPFFDLAVTAQIELKYQRRDCLFRLLHIVIHRHSVRRLHQKVHIPLELESILIIERGSKFEDLVDGAFQGLHIPLEICLTLFLRALIHHRFL